MLKFDGSKIWRRSLNTTCSVAHNNVCFVKSKTKRFVYISFRTISFLGVFETAKLMDVSIKACGTSMVDLNWPLSFNITIFTSAFDLHWLCDEALSHLSHQATALLTIKAALKIGYSYVCVSVLRSMETTFAFTVCS